MTHVLSLVSYQFLPARVGGQKGIALFNKFFSRHLKLTCITTKSNDAAAAEGYEVLNILSNSSFRYINPSYFFTLKKLIRKRNITHLLLEHPYYGWLAVMLKWTTRVKLIVHSHNTEGLRWKTLGKWWWKILWYYEKWVHRQADYNFFIQDNDRNYALEHFSLSPASCITVTYGIEWDKPPSAEEKRSAKQLLQEQHDIPPNDTLLLFNGAFDYLPNLNGLKRILDDIAPQLQQKEHFSFTIMICGRNIPADITSKKYPQVVFAGFVDDISVYFKGCDIFLNPVTEGGGIKTKLVEALGHNMNAVSCQNGSAGVDSSICNGKLMITDDDLKSFPDAIVEMAGEKALIPQEFFDHFYWKNITEKAAAFIQQQ